MTGLELAVAKSEAQNESAVGRTIAGRGEWGVHTALRERAAESRVTYGTALAPLAHRPPGPRPSMVKTPRRWSATNANPI